MLRRPASMLLYYTVHTLPFLLFVYVAAQLSVQFDGYETLVQSNPKPEAHSDTAVSPCLEAFVAHL